MPQDQKNQSDSGKKDIVIIGVICLVAAGLLAFMLIRILSHSEEHVEKVRDTKVLYSESLDWRTNGKLCEKRIKKDLLNKPDRTRAEYNDIELTERAWKLIGKMKHLKVLNVRRSVVQDAWLRHITDLPLETLNLNGTHLGDECISSIVKIKTLVDLNLGDCDITDAGLKELSKHKALKVLGLNHARKITNNGIGYLTGMDNLIELRISSTLLTGDCLKYVADMKELRELKFEEVDSLRAKDLHPLFRCRSLHRLALKATGLTDEALLELSRIKGVQKLELSRNKFTDKGVDYLSSMSQLVRLDLKECNNVTPAAIARIREALPNCVIKYSTIHKFSDTFPKNVFKQVELLESEAKNQLKDSQTNVP